MNLTSSVASRRARTSQPSGALLVENPGQPRPSTSLKACRRHGLSGILRGHVTIYMVMVLPLLGSVGVVVIVVGNYIVAAFNEASGASACRSGFSINVETNASPCEAI